MRSPSDAIVAMSATAESSFRLLDQLRQGISSIDQTTAASQRAIVDSRKAIHRASVRMAGHAVRPPAIE